MLEALLDLGGSPDTRTSDGLTPLYLACVAGGSPRAAMVLLKVAEHWLVLVLHIQKKKCICLQDRAQLNVADSHGWTEMHQVYPLACGKGVLTELF